MLFTLSVLFFAIIYFINFAILFFQNRKKVIYQRIQFWSNIAVPATIIAYFPMKYFLYNTGDAALDVLLLAYSVIIFQLALKYSLIFIPMQPSEKQSFLNKRHTPIHIMHLGIVLLCFYKLLGG